METFKVPKAEFHIGDRVEYDNQDAGMPPTSEAIVCGVEANPRRVTEAEYAVLDLETQIVIDGFTEKTLRLACSPNDQALPRAGREGLRWKITRRRPVSWQRRMVVLRGATVQKMRELIMDIPSGISRAGDDDCWVQWKDWEQYCVRATKLQSEIDRQVFDGRTVRTPTTR